MLRGILSGHRGMRGAQGGFETNAYPAKQEGGTVTEQVKNAYPLLMFDFAIFLKRKSI